MLSKITQFAKKRLSRLATPVNRLFRRITEPARSNIVTGTLADLPRARSELLAENALVRQQLVVLCSQVRTPRLTWRERLSLLFLAHWAPNWMDTLQIIKPDTLLRWHREGFRLFSPVLAVQVARAECVESSESRHNPADQVGW